MAQILVRNIEDDVKEALRTRAKAAGTSLEEFVRDMLRAEAVRSEPEFGLGTRIINIVKSSPYEFPEIPEVFEPGRPVLDFSGPEWDPIEDGAGPKE